MRGERERKRKKERKKERMSSVADGAPEYCLIVVLIQCTADEPRV